MAAEESNPALAQQSESVEVDTPEIDEDALYQQKLEELRAGKESKAHKKAAYTLRQESKQSDDDEYEVIIDDDDIDSKLDRFKNEILSSVSGAVQANALNDAVTKSASSPNEAELIRYHLDNSINRSGNVEQDVANAKALANAHRLSGLTREVKRAQSSGETATTQYAGTQEVSSERKEQLSQEEAQLAAMMKKNGIEANL